MKKSTRVGLAAVLFLVAMNGVDQAATAGPITPQYVRSWGTRGSGNGQFWGPIGIAVDPAGNIWVADSNNNRLQQFTNTGMFLRSVPTGGTGPWGVDVDPTGNVWTANEFSHNLKKFSSTGQLLTTVTGFNYPADVATDPAGNVWVAELSGARVREFNSSGALLRTVGSSGTGNGQFTAACGIDLDAQGNVWVTDLHFPGTRIQKFNSTGGYLGQIPFSGYTYPRDVAVDRFGHIWIADANSDTIVEFDGTGTIQLATLSSANGIHFGHILCLAFDASNNLYATDIGNDRVVVFSTPEPSSMALLIVGALGALSYGDFRTRTRR